MNKIALRSLAVSGVAVVAVLAAASGTASAAPLNFSNTGSVVSSTGSLDETTLGGSSRGMVLNVTNSSSYDLLWVGGSNPYSTPKTIIPANGGTDRIEWHGLNLNLTPTWQVVGTQHNVFPAFSVPLFGGNGAVCTMDEISKNSPVGMSHCDIGKGWDPDAHVTFANTQ